MYQCKSSLSRRRRTFASCAKQVVQLELVAGQQSTDLLLLGKDLLGLDAQACGTFSCYALLVTLL